MTVELKHLQNIINNIEDRGFLRYDPADIRKRIECTKYNIIRRFFSISGSLFPMQTRRLLGITPKRHITSYSHVVEAYLIIEKVKFGIHKKFNSCEIMDEALSHYYDNKARHWPYGINKKFMVSSAYKDSIPTMPMHGLSRINSALIRVGKHYNMSDYIEIATNTAIDAINTFHLKRYADQSMSISYYYNSDDCTLNINTEFAQWLSMLPKNNHTSLFNNIVNGIISLVVKEQNEDGSWWYFSKEHHKKWGGRPTIDAHHTGTVLTNLITVLNNENDVLTEDNFTNLEYCICRGIEYYLHSFFKMTGEGITQIGLNRPAGPVQYSEAIIAFCEFIMCKAIDNKLKTDVMQSLPKIVSQLQRLIHSDGSVASEKIIRWKNLDSIRWGNGPVLQALLMYLSCLNAIEN